MQSGGVVVLGCNDEKANSGLKADEKALAAQETPVAALSTGSVVRGSEGKVESLEASLAVTEKQLGDAIRKVDCKVIKIGALPRVESIKTVSAVLQQNTNLSSVIDAEPFFKTGPSPKPELIASLRTEILPSTTVLSATVPEAKALLDEAGVEFSYPQNMQDVVSMAKALQTLGPRYVIIKREILDDDGKMTTLHYVLTGGPEPVMTASRCNNPKGLFGASYSIPSVIAAQIAKGKSVPEAVSAAYNFVGEMLKGGQYFD